MSKGRDELDEENREVGENKGRGSGESSSTSIYLVLFVARLPKILQSPTNILPATG
jgi:hypothetical protein